ncbi:unnamed protein product [Paramecium primaurelia]|uniref:Uncharacterized protein n=1 Tax=Paramecium primaurelia TaxID=5886 RepID=A0A8S1PU57_PARPR|nr:unnamed protein product [Paramecium primaurelia]
MQEETFQFQQQQVIEYRHRKILKPLQRKLQYKSYDPEEIYSTQEPSLDCNVISIFSKRGTNFSIEEEHHRRIIQNPFVNEVPNFSKLQYQLNYTIQQQPEKTYAPIDILQNELLNQNYSDNKYQNLQNDCYQSIEESFGEEYRLIQVDDFDYLQNFQCNKIDNQKNDSRDKKQIPKKLQQELTKGIHKILIKK